MQFETQLFCYLLSYFATWMFKADFWRPTLCDIDHHHTLFRSNAIFSKASVRSWSYLSGIPQTHRAPDWICAQQETDSSF